MRFGRVRSQYTTFIAGIHGQTVTSASYVLINAAGELGTIVSSRRYKEDIEDIGGRQCETAGPAPGHLPRYTQASAGGARPTQYGLIAEEVAEIYPDIVVYDDEGQPKTVLYHKVNAMLLNEVQRLAFV